MRKDGSCVSTVVGGGDRFRGRRARVYDPGAAGGAFRSASRTTPTPPRCSRRSSHVRSEVGFSAYLVAGQLDAAQKTVEKRPAAWRRSTVWPSGSPPATGGRFRGSQSYTQEPSWTRGVHDGRAGQSEQAGGQNRQRVPAERHGFRAQHGRLAGGLRRGPETRLGFRRVSRRFDSPRSARAYLSYFEWCY
jgi:hypothetical protein